MDGENGSRDVLSMKVCKHFSLYICVGELTQKFINGVLDIHRERERERERERDRETEREREKGVRGFCSGFSHNLRI